MATQLCPECGRPVGAPEGESAQAHINDHWGAVPKREQSKEARARVKFLEAIAATEDVNTKPATGIDGAEE